MPDSPPPADAPAQELTALMARVSLGDRQAFEALYRRSANRLFAIVLRIQRDRGQAEEILQEVYVKVWRSAGSFDADRSTPMAWLSSVARHCAIDSLRRRGTEPVTVSPYRAADDGDGEEDWLQGQASAEPGPLELLRQASERSQLEHCLAGLSGPQRSSLALAYYQGLSHQEVAQSLRQPLGTVKSWVRRGLLSLRDCLDRATGAMAAAGGLKGR